MIVTLRVVNVWLVLIVAKESQNRPIHMCYFIRFPSYFWMDYRRYYKCPGVRHFLINHFVQAVFQSCNISYLVMKTGISCRESGGCGLRNQKSSYSKEMNSKPITEDSHWWSACHSIFCNRVYFLKHRKLVCF